MYPLELTEYAKQNCKGFVYPKETLLPLDYPVNVGYTYVLVWEDGEVKVATSWVQGEVRDFIRSEQYRKQDKRIAEVRRCELVARELEKADQNAD